MLFKIIINATREVRPINIESNFHPSTIQIRQCLRIIRTNHVTWAVFCLIR